jgi:predicted metal-dependent enzyme (double-stranded beta helix superfamily)
MSLTAARRRRKKVRTLTTSGDHAAAMSHPKPADELRPLLAAVREVVAGHLDWHETASSVAAALSRHLPSPAVLSPAQRLGDPDGYRSHVLHAEPDGSFSVVALVWRPGQRTPIHDHVTWCAFGVIQGVEHEELFELDEGGDVCGFAPPGDIHRVRNAGDETAISIHVYGTDVSRIGSSVRRYYDLPVRAADRTA